MIAGTEIFEESRSFVSLEGEREVGLGKLKMKSDAISEFKEAGQEEKEKSGYVVHHGVVFLLTFAR
jgi:hypothetical protein